MEDEEICDLGIFRIESIDVRLGSFLFRVKESAQVLVARSTEILTSYALESRQAPNQLNSVSDQFQRAGSFDGTS